MPQQTPESSWHEPAWLAASAFVPAAVAAGHIGLFPRGDRDLPVVRAVGLGSTGGFRALDAWLAAPFAAIPLGTRALRAELPGVVLLALTAGLLFVLVRRMLVGVAGATSWASIVAAIATATVAFTTPFQEAGTTVGSGLAGVALVLVALVAGPRARPGESAALVTMGLSYDTPSGLLVLAAVLTARLPRERDGSPPPSRAMPTSVEVALGGAAGLVPFVLAALHARVTPLSTSGGLLSAAIGDSGAAGSGARHAAERMVAELGEVLLVLALVGFVASMLRPSSRRAATPLAAVTLSATLLAAETAKGDRDTWSPVTLLALAGALAFAAVAMHEAVRRVARARLPLASASAFMVVLLEAAFPVVQLDDTLGHFASRAREPVAAWEEAALAGLPSGSLVLVSAPRLYARLLATEACGDLPGDLAVVPTFDPANEAAAAALARDPTLVPLFRDLALAGVPQELSLSSLAAARPLVLATDPRWDRALTRHLLPSGLLAVFEPEPRGGTDRKRALAESQASRVRLAKELGTPLDPALASLTTAILFDRAVAAAQTGEREVAELAIADASLFAPRDPRLQQLALRASTARGPIDAHDLAKEGLAGP